MKNENLFDAPSPLFGEEAEEKEPSVGPQAEVVVHQAEQHWHLPDLSQTNLERFEGIGLSVSFGTISGGWTIKLGIQFSPSSGDFEDRRLVRAFVDEIQRLEVLDSSENSVSNWRISGTNNRQIGNSYGRGETKDVTITPSGSVNGQYKVKIPYDTFRTVAGDLTPDSDITSSAVTVDTRAATVAFSNASFTDGKLQATLTATVKGISNVGGDDFSVQTSSGGTPTGTWSISVSSSSVSVNGTITVKATPPNNIEGSYRLYLGTNRFYSVNATGDNRTSPTKNTPTSAINSGNATVNTRPAATATWSNVSYTGGKLQGTITFTGVTGSVTGISSSDFEVLDASNNAQTSWTFDTPATSATIGSGITIAATPPSNTAALFKLNMKSASAISGGSTTANTPRSAVATLAILVANTSGTTIATWKAGSVSGGRDLTGVLSTVGTLVGLSNSDFEVQNSSGTRQTSFTTITAVPSGTITGTGTDIFVRASGGIGSVKLVFKAGSVTTGGGASYPSSNVETALFSVDNRNFLGSVSLTNTHFNVSGQLTTTLNNWDRSDYVTNIQSSDFSVVDSGGNSVSGATIQSPSTYWIERYGTGRRYSIAIQASLPSTASTGFYAIKLNAISLQFQGGSRTPHSDITSDKVFRNRIQATAAWSNVSYCSTSKKLQGTITFNKTNVSGLDSRDFSVVRISGTGSSFTLPYFTSLWASVGVGRTISFSVGLVNGTFKLRLAANSVYGGVVSPASNVDSSTVTIDSRPTITTVQWRSHTFLYHIGWYSQGLTFNSGLRIRDSDLTTSDFFITSVRKVRGASNPSISSVFYSRGYYYARIIPPTRTWGTYTITLRANALPTTDSYLGGPSSSSTSPQISFDSRSAVAVSSFTAPTNSASSPLTAAKVNFTLTFGISVDATELTTTDFTGTNGASVAAATDISPRTGSASRFTISVTQPTRNSGTYTITLGAGTIREVSSTSSSTAYRAGPRRSTTTTAVHYNTRVIATAAWSAASFCTTSGKLTATLTFSGANITGIAAGDFEILDNTSPGVVQSGWTISAPTTATAGTGIIISATPPANTNASYKLRLKATSVRSDGSTTDNAPAAAQTTSAVAVDSRPQLTVSSFTAPTNSSGSPLTATTAALTFTFNTSIPASELCLGDFSIATTRSSGSGNVSLTSLSPTTGSQTTYNLTVTHPNQTTGTYTVTLAANAVGPSTATTYKQGPTAAYTTAPIHFQILPDVATATWSTLSWTEPQVSTALRFGEAAITAGIETSDFEVVDNATPPVIQTGWTFETPFSLPAGVTVWSDGGVPSGSQARGITNDGTKIYVVYQKGTSGARCTTTDFFIRRYTTSGTYESAGDVALSFPPKPSGITLTSAHTQPISIRGLERSGTYWYVIYQWDATENKTSIEIHNANGTHLQNLAVITGTQRWQDLAINSNKLYALVYEDQVDAWDLASNGLSLSNPETDLIDYWIGEQGLAVDNNRIYLFARHIGANPPGPGIVIYDKATTPARVPLEDITLPSTFRRVNLTVLGNKIYGVPENINKVYAYGKAVPTTTAANSDTLSWTDSTIPTGSVIVGTTGLNGKIYVLYQKGTQGSRVAGDWYIRRYTTAGVYESAGDVSLALPTRPTAVSTASTQPAKARGFANYNSKWYVLFEWANRHSSIEIYNSGTHAGNLIVDAVEHWRGMDIDPIGQKLYTVVWGHRGDRYDLNDAGTTATNQHRLFTLGGIQDLAVSADRIYAYTRRFSNTDRTRRIMAYVKSTVVRRPHEDLNPDLSTYEPEITVLGNRIYGGAENRTTIYSYGLAFPIVVNAPTNLNASYRLRLKATSLRSDDSNSDNAPAAAVLSAPIAVDTRPSVGVSGWVEPSGTQTGTTITLTLQLDRSVPTTEVTIGDFSGSDGATITDLTPVTSTNSQSYSVTVTQPTNFEGTYTITLAANSITATTTTTYRAGPTADSTSDPISADTRTKATAAWGTPTYSGNIFSAALTFTGANIAGLSSADFEILDDSDVTQTTTTTGQARNAATDWTINVVNTTVTAGTAETITVTPPENTDGTYKIRLKTLSVISDGGTTNNAPTAVAVSSAIAVDNRPDLTVTSFTAPSALQTGRSADLTLTLDRDVPETELTASDFSATDGAQVTDVEEKTVIRIQLTSAVRELTMGDVKIGGLPSGVTLESVDIVGTAPSQLWELTFDGEISDVQVGSLTFEYYV